MLKVKITEKGNQYTTKNIHFKENTINPKNSILTDNVLTNI